MPADTTELKQRLEFALAAAREASTLILPYYNNPDLAVELKGDESPVTAADRGAEELLRKLIAEEYPADGILGEEFGEREGTSGYRWILDPIDGTVSFVHGVPLFGTLIGLEQAGEAKLGVCRMPALDETVYAASGCGAWWQTGGADPRPARVSDTDRLDRALFSYTALELFAEYHRRSAFDALMDSVASSRAWGDCYGHILVATGRADLMVDPVMNAWDAAPLLPILREAGGSFVDWTGSETIYGGNGISVNARLRDAVVEVVTRD
ncbi:MAG: histidinol-phosphatase [Planctomycetota bacterium]|nr:MAG: histidinol-phosphatase [Planctomycetota bacterium]REK29039.1 MAG: histidinol-phosphatase [Planctomycetota bacterium]REK39715.1 MAG: histidinol-phosphatase [Planctomycetota bacterium]